MQTMVNNIKAQMKIQQMAIMLLAVTLFFVLIGIFAVTFKLSGLKETSVGLAEENAQLLVTKIANSPEFSCGSSFGTQKLDCVDEDKALSLKQSISRYIQSDFWGSDVSNIEIRKVYPENSKECDLGNYPDCGVIRLLSGDLTGTAVGNFVLLCRKEASDNGAIDKCEVAKIFVSYNQQ